MFLTLLSLENMIYHSLAGSCMDNSKWRPKHGAARPASPRSFRSCWPKESRALGMEDERPWERGWQADWTRLKYFETCLSKIDRFWAIFILRCRPIFFPTLLHQTFIQPQKYTPIRTDDKVCIINSPLTSYANIFKLIYTTFLRAFHDIITKKYRNQQ